MNRDLFLAILSMDSGDISDKPNIQSSTNVVQLLSNFITDRMASLDAGSSPA